jgi:hypothetical protein
LNRITISYTEKEEIWINDHPEINVSALFRKLIDFLIDRGTSILSTQEAKAIFESAKEREVTK